MRNENKIFWCIILKNCGIPEDRVKTKRQRKDGILLVQ